MKKAKKLLTATALCAAVVLGCTALVACGGDKKSGGDNPPVVDTDPAGTYTLVANNITYSLTIEENNDFNMTITKDCDTYKIVKTYLGPTHNISGDNGEHRSTMPVFLSSVEYDGTGAPDDQEKLEKGIQAAFAAIPFSDGELGRERFITLDLANSTFSVDPEHDGKPVGYKTLDYTEGLWTVADLETAGYTYDSATGKWTAPQAAAK